MPDTAAATPIDVLRFWWAAGPEAWFRSDPDFDARVGTVLGPLAAEALAGGLVEWEETPHGALALLLLLDQVPRNTRRGTAEAFAGDDRALAVARRAVAAGFVDAFPPQVRSFFILPFEHAEDIQCQEQSVDLFRRLSDRESLHWALLHYEAVSRFGRFPHRNAILGRQSTPEEEAWLASGGFGG
jgi:uncharacterized protein (DUF924 family)